MLQNWRMSGVKGAWDFFGARRVKFSEFVTSIPCRCSPPCSFIRQNPKRQLMSHRHGALYGNGTILDNVELTFSSADGSMRVKHHDGEAVMIRYTYSMSHSILPSMRFTVNGPLAAKTIAL